MAAKKPVKPKKPVAKTTASKSSGKSATVAAAKRKSPSKVKPLSKVTAKPAKPAAKKTAPPAKAASKVVSKPVKAAPKAVKPAAKPAPKPVAPAKPVATKPVATKPVAAKGPAIAQSKAVAISKTPAAKPAPAKLVPIRTASGKQVIVTSTGKAPPPIPVRPRPALSPVRDADGRDRSLALLSGPRDVKPYVVKKGELYMSKLQLEHFRLILSTWKRDLMEEVDRTVTHMKDEAANPPDPNDRATLESEFSLELRTRDRERKLIRKIDEALGRIEDGSYGYCLETGEEIGIKRLEARPVATLSIEAQERRERREKQYGDRDDRFR